ncbi:Signal transduction histidine kinase [Azospirillum argentinense]
MQLDGNTLFAMTGGMIFLSALVATLLYKLHTSVPGPRGWAWGNILVGVFFLLRMLPAPVPEWLSIAVANGILLQRHRRPQGSGTESGRRAPEGRDGLGDPAQGHGGAAQLSRHGVSRVPQPAGRHPRGGG